MIAQLVRTHSTLESPGLTEYRTQIEDNPLVSFLPLDLTSEDSLETIVSHIDFTMQYGEDEEPREVSPF